jgi:UDP-N-acetylglucosamine:LPS N-acetylglucosamine transferase
MLVRAKRIVAIASGGGHWVQLLRIRPAFAQAKVTFVTVSENYRSDVAGDQFIAIHDATRWSKVALIIMAIRILGILLRVRPDVVITTGAAPGFFGIVLGKCLGAKTIWIDSIANAEELSLSGKQVRTFADLWLTQWDHLSRPNGPQYAGAVL